MILLPVQYRQSKHKLPQSKPKEDLVPVPLCCFIFVIQSELRQDTSQSPSMQASLPLALSVCCHRANMKRLCTDYSIRSSEHLIISEIHLRKSILITLYGMADVPAYIIHGSRNILLTYVKDIWTGIHLDKIGQSQPPNWTYANCRGGVER